MGRTPVNFNMTDIKNSFFIYKKPINITHNQYISFIKDCNKALIKWVLDGNKLPLPFSLGTIYVERKKPFIRMVEINGKLVPRHSLVDFSETLKLRKRLQPTWGHKEWKELPVEDRAFVIHTNQHTQGYSYTIKWDRTHAHKLVKNFMFMPNHKTFSKELAKVLKSDDINKPHYYDKQQIHQCRSNSGESKERLTPCN